MKKKAFSLFVAVCFLFSTYTATFAAENEKYVDQAEKLNIIGVFKGTAQGFELDRKATD